MVIPQNGERISKIDTYLNCAEVFAYRSTCIKSFSLMTNYSLIQPESTKNFIVPGDDRYERALQILGSCTPVFAISDAFSLLYEVRQEGMWATRVSFVYSAEEQSVYYVQNNNFEHITKFTFTSEK